MSAISSIDVHCNHSDDGIIERWSAESTLVARPFLGVERLPPGGYAFVGALSLGERIAAAAKAAVAAAPDFDVDCALALLAEANIVIGFRENA